MDLVARSLEALGASRAPETVTDAWFTREVLRPWFAACCARLAETHRRTPPPCFARGDVALPDVAMDHPDTLAAWLEQVLELRPRRDADGRFVLARDESHARRRSGSYYTPPALVEQLLALTLDPLLDAGARPDALRVCDPACGAGAMLLAAGRRLVARGGDPVTVFSRCLHGVDLHPVAVDLCRFALWWEGADPDALTARVREGNALLDDVTLPGEDPGVPWRAFAGDGFDAVLGNPPWIAHAGRAAQPLSPALRAHYAAHDPAFARYRSTHGMFVHLGARVLRPGGRLGLILPSSVADLDGYAPARRAHDRWCDIERPLTHFGDSAFSGVFQPCMALASVRRTNPNDLADGAPWPMARDDLDDESSRLLARLAAMPAFAPETFGERGWHSTPSTRAMLRESAAPVDGCTVPIREGGDVRAFELRPPRWHVDPRVGIRDASVYREVTVLVRQTARYPVAAVGDGGAFRNSLLACTPRPPWTPAAMCALLNATLLRWFHHQRFRDAREGMPQVKVSHLRALPGPPRFDPDLAARATRWAARNEGLTEPERDELDARVADLYGLTDAERDLIARWRARGIR